ncbi:hypothetical protein FTV88_0804 [Heliorestis convoluta]|uniref:Uncharacterized protein n=1 Tax=Heliorestis convoluta TaxID=356322 RepID=A0A5Q2MWU7_9FIRM|nr:hypothetical protein FTV88_0804 [Heliorestis convoluta]
MPDRAERKLCRGIAGENRRGAENAEELLRYNNSSRLEALRKNPNKLFLENCTEKASKAM